MISQQMRDALKHLATVKRLEEKFDFIRVHIGKDKVEIWGGKGDPGDGKGQFGIINEQKP